MPSRSARASASGCVSQGWSSVTASRALPLATSSKVARGSQAPGEASLGSDAGVIRTPM
ncbi:hypothetical protein WKI45_05650 [Delftia tsuruhatensis]